MSLCQVFCATESLRKAHDRPRDSCSRLPATIRCVHTCKNTASFVKIRNMEVTSTPPWQQREKIHFSFVIRSPAIEKTYSHANAGTLQLKCHRAWRLAVGKTREENNIMLVLLVWQSSTCAPSWKQAGEIRICRSREGDALSVASVVAQFTGPSGRPEEELHPGLALLSDREMRRLQKAAEFCMDDAGRLNGLTWCADCGQCTYMGFPPLASMFRKSLCV